MRHSFIHREWPAGKDLVCLNGKCRQKVTYHALMTGRAIISGGNQLDVRGKEVFWVADNIVLATGATPDKSLAQALRGKDFEVYEVGDCVEARQLLEAIHEGAEAALQI